MKIARTEVFENNYAKLSASIRKKVDKQLRFIQQDMKHPSLRVKKMQGIDRFEARVDRSYRLTFEKSKDIIMLRTVGHHDEGLGKK